MSNNQSLYIGAYLEIAVKPVRVMRLRLQCKNGHVYSTGYCPLCGEKIQNVSIDVEEMPAHIVPWLLPDEWEDVLAVITPPSLFQTGVILAKGNEGKPSGDWYHFSRYNWDEEVKPIPAPDDAAGLVSDLETNYSDIIAALKASPAVLSVELKIGIVVDIEY
jgi:hypothetical protein